MKSSRHDDTVARFLSRTEAIRNHQQWSQRELAERITRSGYPMTRDSLANLTTRRGSVRLSEALAIAEALDVPLSDLISPAPLRFETKTVVIE